MSLPSVSFGKFSRSAMNIVGNWADYCFHKSLYFPSPPSPSPFFWKRAHGHVAESIELPDACHFFELKKVLLLFEGKLEEVRNQPNITRDHRPHGMAVNNAESSKVDGATSEKASSRSPSFRKKFIRRPSNRVGQRTS